jgi:anti-sigma factor (TIGR02949 family)
MECGEVRKFLHAFLDSEFAEEDRVALAAHLGVCESCRALASFEQLFQRSLRATTTTVRAPAALAARVSAALESEAKAQRSAPAAPGWGARLAESWARRWLWRLIPAAAAAAIVAGVFVSKRRDLSSDVRLAEESIAWHRRQIPMDIAGPRPELVERFFSDKVPFAVRPPNFEGRKAELVGGRLSNLGEHQAVLLVYQVGGRRVSVFILDPDALPSVGIPRHVAGRDIFLRGLRGYNVAMYSSGGTGYAVASDLEPDRLVQLISTTH